MVQQDVHPEDPFKSWVRGPIGVWIVINSARRQDFMVMSEDVSVDSIFSKECKCNLFNTILFSLIYCDIQDIICLLDYTQITAP